MTQQVKNPRPMIWLDTNLEPEVRNGQVAEGAASPTESAKPTGILSVRAAEIHQCVGGPPGPGQGRPVERQELETLAADGGGVVDGLARGFVAEREVHRDADRDAGAVSPDPVGRDLPGVHQGPAGGDAGAGLVERASSGPVAGLGRALLAGPPMVRLCGGRLAGGMPADRGQPTRTRLRRPQEDRPAVVPDDDLSPEHGA